MEWLQADWIDWVLSLVGVAVGMWVIPNKIWAKLISFFGTKLAPVMDRVADGMDAAGTIADGAGLEKVAAILHKGSYLVDEAEDIPRLLAEYTEDDELTSDEIKTLIEETGEVGVAFKNFTLVFKKKE